MKKILLVATIIFSLNVCLFAQKQENFNHIGLYTMRIGKIEAIVISDGHLCVNPVQAEFAQRIDSVKVAKTLQEHFAPVTEVDLAMNILLLKIGNRYVLIDAGAGYVFGCESGWLAANLSYAGIQPDKVTDIIITHAHPDHIGGLTDKKGNLVFPNAEIFLSREEYNFWMSPAPDFTQSTMTDKKHMKMLVDVAQKNIRSVTDKLHLFQKDEELLGCLQMIPAPGHTPGHTILRIHSGREEIYHIADVVHSEIISFEHPEWIYNSDTDYKEGIETRKKILEQLSNSGSLFFAYHLPWPGLGYVKSTTDGYEWVQKRIAMPY